MQDGRYIVSCHSDVVTEEAEYMFKSEWILI